MKNLYLCGVLFLIFSSPLLATEWHVKVNGTPTGNGSATNPWNLQTALNHPSVILPGDTIWLHGGDYKGRFTSHLNGTSGSYITVCSYPGELAVLDGQFASTPATIPGGTSEVDAVPAVLNVVGGYTIFKNFEITRRGINNRNVNTAGMEIVGGINHTDGVNCKFINLVIYNTTGTGIGSWKSTAGTEFYGCLVYNNGWEATDRAHGPGFYVQNASDQTRIIKNNIVFNNYYKGIDVWSANPNTTGLSIRDFVKNVTLDGNAIFNNATPSSHRSEGPTVPLKKDNIMVGTDDATGVNRARNINIINNFLYHTTDFTADGTLYEAPTLTIGWNPNAPVENVTVFNNYIFGRNSALRFFYAKTLKFDSNVIWGRYVIVNPNNSNSNDISNWDFTKNSYFTRYNTLGDPTHGVFQFPTYKIAFSEWQNNFTIDQTSFWHQAVSTDFDPFVCKITQNQYDTNKFTVVLFNKAGANQTAYFNYAIPVGTPYKVRDAENYHTILATGTLNSTSSITFDMQSIALELPTELEMSSTTNLYAIKSATNFGTFLVEFDMCSIPHDLVISNQTLNTVNLQQAENSIVFGTNFINDSSANTTAKASTYISIVPGSVIKAGSQFLAKIEAVSCATTAIPYVAENNTYSRNAMGEKSDETQNEQPVISKALLISPNPNNGVFKISLNEITEGTIQITDLIGFTIFNTEFKNQKEFDINMQEKPKGIYIVRVLSGNEVFTGKIIKN